MATALVTGVTGQLGYYVANSWRGEVTPSGGWSGSRLWADHR